MLDALGLNALFFAAGVFGFLKLLQKPAARLADTSRRIALIRIAEIGVAAYITNKEKFDFTLIV